MNKNIPNPGEIWSFFDTKSIKRECLVLTTTHDGYVIGWFCHTYTKHPDNVLLKPDNWSGKKDIFIDPRKLTYWHTPNMIGRLSAVSTIELNHIKKTSIELLFPFFPVNEVSEGRGEDLSAKVRELTIERDLYKGLVESALAGVEVKAPVQEPEKTEEKPIPRTKAEIAEDNKKLYLPKQAYINVKLKAMRMSQTTLSLMVGCSNSTISAWSRGIQPAKWKLLERVFPGIEAEATEWAEKQVIPGD